MNIKKKVKVVSFWGISFEKLRRRKDPVNPERDSPFHYIFKILEKKYIILDEISKEKPDIVLHFDFVISAFFKYRDAINIYVALEPEIVEKNHSKERISKYLNYFDYILTWNDELIDNQLFFKINFPYHFGKVSMEKKNFDELKLLVNISGNKESSNPKELYSKRKEVIEYFEDKNEEFELYGPSWGKKNYKNYKGKIDKKSSAYKNFKFSLCLENMVGPGYITEKIFDCFELNIVPIYSGGNEDQIPKECYINYFDFESVEKLHLYLKNMKKEEWETYLENGKKWLKTENKRPFEADFFAKQIEKVLERPKRIKEKKYIILKKIESLFYLKKNLRKIRKRIKKFLKEILKWEK